jgi:hypothetical protein
MNKHTNQIRKHQVSGLPLFDWRSAVVHQPTTHAGLHIARKYKVSPLFADLLAQFAGLGVVDREAR